jgi:hypothetical protein
MPHPIQLSTDPVEAAEVYIKNHHPLFQKPGMEKSKAVVAEATTSPKGEEAAKAAKQMVDELAAKLQRTTAQNVDQN